MLKKSVVIKAKPIKTIKNVRIDYKTVVFYTVFVCGIICGIALFKVGNDDLTGFVSSILNSYTSSKSENGIFGCFCISFLFMLILLFGNYINGMCAVGIPLISVVPFIFGLFCSVCISTYFVNYGLDGLIYCIITDVPFFALTAAVLIKGCGESVKMSLELFDSITNSNKTEKVRLNLLKDYTIMYLILCVPIAIGAMISALIFNTFSSFFTFI